ncbi:MAG: YdcF family protein [Pseudomonadota bacterium]|nr:YdcF family protein [Pseudomonadota bacterium]
MRYKPLLIIILLSLSLLFVLLFKEFFDLTKKSDEKIYSDYKFDVIIVLTGGSNRIKKGFYLLEKNYSKKMFISGVNPIVKKDDIRKIVLQNSEIEKNSLFDCCVFLGKNAKNTKSNAVEVLTWMKKNNLKSAILVTTDIHLPRSILEFQNNTNHIRIATWPVESKNLQFLSIVKEFLRFSFVRIKYLTL